MTTRHGAMWQMIIGILYRKIIMKITIITCHIAPCGKEAVPMIVRHL